MSEGNSPASQAEHSNFGELPLSFVPNLGQTDPTVQFQVSSLGNSVFFTADAVVLTLPTPRHPLAYDPAARATRPSGPAHSPAHLQMHFQGANPAPGLAGTVLLPGTVSYFRGSDQEKWRSHLPTYAGLVYHDLYPGIDVQYEGSAERLKATYVVSPGADPNLIRWRYEGASDVHIESATGNLLVAPPVIAGGADGTAQTLTEEAPIAWQDFDGLRVQVASQYVLDDVGQVGFALANYDLNQPLIIDPALVYSTYLGGCCFDVGDDIVRDHAGNIFITGPAFSDDFPTRAPLDGIFGGFADGFVAKLSGDGRTLIYSTYLGGFDFDETHGIAIDIDGNAYVTGTTGSPDFPISNALQSSFGGVGDGFITKLDPTGSALVYSTYLGGRDNDHPFAIVVDTTGSVYVTGTTQSSDFPTRNSLQASNHGGADAFVAKLNAAGTALIYSTYLGGSGDDRADISDNDQGLSSLAVDETGNAYITGTTRSLDFPIRNAYQTTNHGSPDAFVAKVNSTGSALVYSTYVGGSGEDFGFRIALDSIGNAFVTGRTTSSNFPTQHALQSSNRGGSDAFVAKLSPTGSALVYSTYLGGSGEDEARGITVDSRGDAWLTGSTDSANFPSVAPLQPTNHGGPDAFVANLNTAGTALLFSTYLGGHGNDHGISLVVDSAGNTYVTGTTSSSDFPTKNPLQPTNRGFFDVFLLKVAPGPGCALSATRAGPPAQIDITVQSPDAGVATIVATQAVNTSVAVPAFTRGTRAPIVVTATKINQTLTSQVALRVTDLAGNVTLCDPVIVQLVDQRNPRPLNVFRGLNQAESKLQLTNGLPGLERVDVYVNGKHLRLDDLHDNEVRAVDVASLMRPGDRNTIMVKTHGPRDSSALLAISD
jgi:hypothetical protein